MHRDDYCAQDANGNWYNTIFPPNSDIKKYPYDGYSTNAEEVIFKEFAIMCYDVSFEYEGESYYLKFDWDHTSLSDANFNEEYERFDDAIDLIRNLKIKGKPLLSIIKDLKEVQQW